MGLVPTKPPRPRPKRPTGQGPKPVVCEYCDSIFGKETECRNCGAPRPLAPPTRKGPRTFVEVFKTSSTGPR